jgi:hypothetical protein
MTWLLTGHGLYIRKGLSIDPSRISVTPIIE